MSQARISTERPIGPELNWFEALRANSYSPLYILRVIYVVCVHFVLALHNGWIDPRLRQYEQGRNQREQIRNRQNAATQRQAAAAPAAPAAPQPEPPVAEDAQDDTAAAAFEEQKSKESSDDEFDLIESFPDDEPNETNKSEDPESKKEDPPT